LLSHHRGEARDGDAVVPRRARGRRPLGGDRVPALPPPRRRRPTLSRYSRGGARTHPRNSGTTLVCGVDRLWYDPASFSFHGAYMQRRRRSFTGALALLAILAVFFSGGRGVTKVDAVGKDRSE